MVKRAHHRSAARYVLAGTIGTLGALAVSTQVASANHIIVKAGDTVWKIAQDHHTTVSAVENANTNAIKKVSDSVDLIYAGQQLTLPGNDTTMQEDENGRYTVKPGDTLSEIAQSFHVSVATLMAWNGLTSNQLYIGQQLVVDGQGVTVAPAASSTSMAETLSAAPVDSAAPAASQGTAAVASNAQQPLQSAGVDQQTVPASSSADLSTSTSNAAATASAGTSATTQPAETATTNSAASANTVSQSNAVSAGVVSGSASSAASAAATPASTVTVASTTYDTAAATASATPVSATASTPVSAVSTVQANTTVPVSAASSVTPAASASAVAPQPVASQATSSVSQTPASQAAASQAPVQSSQPASAAPAQPQSSASQNLNSGSVVSLAVKIANTNSVPYVWGGSSLSGMDCSGLVDYVYANAEGKQLPHNTVALESCVNQHAVSEAEPGDVLFWGQHGATYHCAIYTGNNQFVAAAKPGTNVASYTISPYFEPSFAGTVK